MQPKDSSRTSDIWLQAILLFLLSIKLGSTRLIITAIAIPVRSGKCTFSSLRKYKLTPDRETSLCDDQFILICNLQIHKPIASRHPPATYHSHLEGIILVLLSSAIHTCIKDWCLKALLGHKQPNIMSLFFAPIYRAKSIFALIRAGCIAFTTLYICCIPCIRNSVSCIRNVTIALVVQLVARELERAQWDYILMGSSNNYLRQHLQLNGKGCHMEEVCLKLGSVLEERNKI